MQIAGQEKNYIEKNIRDYGSGFTYGDFQFSVFNLTTVPTETQQTEDLAFSFGFGAKAALVFGLGAEVGVMVDKSFNIYVYASGSVGMGIQTPAVTNGYLSVKNYMKNSIGKQYSMSLNPSTVGLSSANTADICLGINGTYDLDNMNSSGLPNSLSIGSVGGGVWKTGTIIIPVFVR